MSMSPDAVETCDVCIVGAGLAGMNALFVASQYLSRGQRVILVDRRSRVGGMWVDTYPYVRLHQPHPMFTAGNIAWTLGKPPAHLATKGEVLDHFLHCLEVIKRRIDVDEYFGWTMESADDTGTGIRVACRSGDGARVVIEAKRLIKAFGFEVEPNDPLPLSSNSVRSVSPNSCDMRGGDIGAGRDPVWIIGGGKTAMDTAHAVITSSPGREVNMVAGSGTFFQTREKFFPGGRQRWWGGALISGLGADLAARFDGTNETELWDWHRSTYGTWLTPDTGNFALGVLSDAERSTIAAGLGEVVMGHLVDIEDRDGVPQLVLRDGTTTAIRPGSWVVNCTGYMDVREHPYEPYTWADGNVLSIQIRSMPLHLTSYIAYFMTHLMFLDKLAGLPLYELDGHELRAKSRMMFPYALMTLVQYNIGMIADTVPSRVFRDCGLDFDRWYPPHRRVAATARFMLSHRRAREQQRRTLDTVRDRLDIRCGPLPSTRVDGRVLRR